MAGGGQLRFTTPEDGTGVRIVDPIERKRINFETDRPVSPTPIATDQFFAPIDAAVSIDPGRIQYDSGAVMFVRGSDGRLEADITAGTTEAYPQGTYILETSMPVKVYFRIEGQMTIQIDTGQTEIDLENADQVAIGARSLHNRPAGVIETTPSPSDLRQAISLLSSSLKTTSPERSFPTLRGHPPRIELGDRYSVPAGIDRPDMGIQLEVPDDIPTIFEAAPLSFYLSAELTQGSTPRLVTDSGWDRALGVNRPFRDDVERVLKQVFLLDCIVRTEGLYPVDLHERNELEPELHLDLPALYEMSIPDRLERYLEIPFETVEPHIPRWKTTAHLAPGPDQVAVLPFALDDLALVRVESPTVHEKDTPSVPRSETTLDGALFRSLSEFGDTEDLLDIPATESLEDAWYGEGIPFHGSKGSVQAHLNRLGRRPKADSISVAVVQNDSEMAAEGRIDSVYGNDTDLPFAVTRHQDLTKAELRDILQNSYDFLHFIGHVTEAGLQCADGFLDTQSLDVVGVDAFLLNACRSYNQGRGLIEAGAVGGVVTINDVVNTEAVSLGWILARLLNSGFHLGAALEIAADETVIGDLYKVLGDSGIQVAQTDMGVSDLSLIESADDGFEVSIMSFPNANMGLGTLAYPTFSDAETRYLVSGTIELGRVRKSQMIDILSLENQPLRIDGQLHWTGDLELADIR